MKVKDKLTFNEEIELPVDLVVLSVGMVPRRSEIFSMLKVPFSRDGFLQEVHPKLRPVETAIGGVLMGAHVRLQKIVLRLQLLPQLQLQRQQLTCLKVMLS